MTQVSDEAAQVRELGNTTFPRLVIRHAAERPLAPALRPGRPLRPRPRPEGAPKPDFPGAALLLAAAWLGLGVAGTAVGLGIALRTTARARLPARRPRPAGR